MKTTTKNKTLLRVIHGLYDMGESVGGVANVLHHEHGLQWERALAYAETYQPSKEETTSD